MNHSPAHYSFGKASARTPISRNPRRRPAISDRPVARGLSQEALAVHAEIDRTYVSRFERGLENPSVAVLERLAKALSDHRSAAVAVRSTNTTPTHAGAKR